MAKNGKGMLNNPYNEVANHDPNSPDDSGGGLYVSYDEVMAMHGKTLFSGDFSTPNSEAQPGLMGHEAPGDPSPVGGDE